MMKTKRRVGDSIHIGEATVHVLNLNDGHVELGIRAPREIPIDVQNSAPSKPEREDRRKSIA